MLQLLYHSLMTKLPTPPFEKLFKHLKKRITLLKYLLPCPATCVPITSSRRRRTVGHFARPSTECSWYRNWWRARLRVCVRDKGGHFELWQVTIRYMNEWSLKQWSNVPIHRMCFFFKSVNNSQSYHKSSAQLCYQELVEQCNILNFCVLHGSATRFSRNGEKYYIYYVQNLLLFPTVKEFSKSVNSWSYCIKFDTTFFETHGLYLEDWCQYGTTNTLAWLSKWDYGYVNNVLRWGTVASPCHTEEVGSSTSQILATDTRHLLERRSPT